MQMTIRIPDEYKAKIEDVSGKTGLRKSDIARMAIKKFLEDFDIQARADRPSDKVQDLIGVVSSGISDLGTNHRQYLLNLMREQKQ
ncbi:MAG: ribbon-helix-helix domain-containing protein [Desulfonatronovibrio sp.]